MCFAGLQLTIALVNYCSSAGAALTYPARLQPVYWDKQPYR